jgi:hypothetical protein
MGTRSILATVNAQSLPPRLPDTGALEGGGVCRSRGIPTRAYGIRALILLSVTYPNELLAPALQSVYQLFM